MKKSTTLLTLTALALVGCGGSHGGGTTPPPPVGGYPEGRLDGYCKERNSPEFGCWLDVHGESVEWGLQSGTRGQIGTLRKGKLSVGPYDNHVNVSRNRVWIDSGVGPYIDVKGGER